MSDAGREREASDLEAEVVGWLLAEAPVVIRRPVTRDLRLTHDLRITGDDGEDLMIAFADRFGVVMPTMRHDRHWAPEGFNPLDLWRLFRRERLYPIKVGDLVEAARTGRLDYDYEGRTPEPV